MISQAKMIGVQTDEKFDQLQSSSMHIVLHSQKVKIKL